MEINIKVVSLKRDHIRRNMFTKNFNSLFKFEFYDAFDGATELEKLDKYTFKNNGIFRKRKIGNNEKACALSHFMLLKSVSNEDFENLIVLEDDIEKFDAVRLHAFLSSDLEENVVYLLGGQEGLKLEKFWDWCWRIHFFMTGNIFLPVPAILRGRIYRTCCYALSRNAARRITDNMLSLSLADDWKHICESARVELKFLPVFKHPICLKNSSIQNERDG